MNKILLSSFFYVFCSLFTLKPAIAADLNQTSVTVTKIAEVKPIGNEYKIVSGDVLTDSEMNDTQGSGKSYQYICTNCGAYHGGVYSNTLCYNCFYKFYGMDRERYELWELLR